MMHVLCSCYAFRRVNRSIEVRWGGQKADRILCPWILYRCLGTPPPGFGASVEILLGPAYLVLGELPLEVVVNLVECPIRVEFRLSLHVLHKITIGTGRARLSPRWFK
jgi:hypothetical protein